MVDFARLLKEMRDNATPEQLARMDARQEREDRFEQTSRSIPAIFERLELRPEGLPLGRLGNSVRKLSGTGMKQVVTKSWEQNVDVRIEDREKFDGSSGEIIRFMNAVTGHESFNLDEDFVRILEDPEELAARPRFYICAGTAGKYDACSVEPAAIAEYLREQRPALFAAAAPRP